MNQSLDILNSNNMRGFSGFSSDIFATDLRTGTSGSIELNIWLAQLCGVPILGLKKESLCLKVFLLVYGIPATIFVTYIYTYFELYDFVLCWPNLDNMTQNSCLSLTHVAGAYKVANTFYRLDDIAKVIDKLKFLTRKFIISKKQQKAYLDGEWQNKMFLMLYASLVGITGVMGMCLLYYSPEKVAGKSFPYRVYLPEWLPYDVRMIYMGMGVLIFALQIVSIDYLNITMMNQLRFHLNTLNVAFEELVLTDDDNGPIGEKSISTIISPNERLKAIIDHHTHLKSLRDDIEDLFRIPVLMQFATSLSIFALTGFQATVSRSDTNGAVLIYFYCCCILCELFFYCWFGNEVFEQNKTLADSGFSSIWYKFDARFKKSLLIFITNAQRPILFTAGGFMSLSLPSFAGILSRAYTYIAVLRQMSGK